MAARASAPKCHARRDHAKTKEAASGRSIAPSRRTFKRVLAVGVGLLIGTLAVLSAIVTDVIRLGPSSYPLPDDALRVVVTPFWLSAYRPTDPDYDFYDLIIQIYNGVYTAEVQPSAGHVRVDLDGARSIGHYWPEATYSMEGVSERKSPCNSILTAPAGDISPGSYFNWSTLEAYHFWRVQGEVEGRYVPIFKEKAEFCLHAISVPEGSGLQSLTTVTLTWSYRGSLQVYPIADRTVAVEANHQW